jgi:hypothetical protein
MITQPVKKFPTFKESESLLPCLKWFATGLYPEPVESSPYPQTTILILILNLLLIIITKITVSLLSVFFFLGLLCLLKGSEDGAI